MKKRTIRIKESEFKKLLELMLIKERDPGIAEPEIEPGIETDEPDIETDKPITPEKEPWEDPFTPRRISPGSEPQPRASTRKRNYR